MKSASLKSVGVVFITHNAKRHLPNCLPPVLQSALKPRVLVVNSSSGDGTVELAKEMGAEVLVVPRNTFNHGLTREQARKHLNTDIVVMMTPDAYAESSDMLERLIEPISSGKASVAYARQLPHKDAGFFGAFARNYNYPEKGHIRGIEDLEKYGVYTFFCSDSCAAYDNRALDNIGGFSHVLLGEDTIAVAKLLRQGKKIAYAADALVRHSHDYTLWQEFQRHFDTGLARKQIAGLLAGASDNKRGKDYVRTLFKHLNQTNRSLIPYACLQTLAKFTGYHIGKRSVNAPLWWKRLLSSQDFYWK